MSPTQPHRQENNDTVFFLLRSVFFAGSVAWAVSVVFQIRKIPFIAQNMPALLGPVILWFLLYTLFFLFLIKKFPGKKGFTYGVMMIFDTVFVTLCIARTGQGNSNFYLGYNIFIAAYTLAIGAPCGAASAILSSILYFGLFMMNPDRYFAADFAARLGFMFLVFFVVAAISGKQQEDRRRIDEDREKIDELNRRLEQSFQELMDEKEAITQANRDKSLMLQKQTEITERRRSHIAFSKELNAKTSVIEAIQLFSRYIRSLLNIDGIALLITGGSDGGAKVYNVSDKKIESHETGPDHPALSAVENAPGHTIAWKKTGPDDAAPDVFAGLLPDGAAPVVIRAGSIMGDNVNEAGIFVLYHHAPKEFDEGLMEEISILSNHLGIDIHKIRYSMKLQELADTDGLTGVYNHRTFQDKLDHELVRSARYNRPLALLLFDIDHFKKLNDTLGHPAGDAVLRGLARFVKSALRNVDIFARYGGEEFVVILPETPLENSLILADRLRKGIEEFAFPLDNGDTTNVTVSIGAAGFPQHATKQELISAADQALYRAKQDGRNRVMS